MADPVNVKVQSPKVTQMMSAAKSPGSRDPFAFFNKTKKRGVLDRLNDKQSWLAQQDPAAPYKFWRKGTGSPLGSAAASALIAGYGAYKLSPWLLKKFNEKLPASMQEDLTDDQIKKNRSRMAILAALGVGGLSVATHLDTRNPVGSMTDWNYRIPKQAMLSSFTNQDVMLQDVIPLDHAKEIISNDKFLTSGQKAAIGTIFDHTPDKKGAASMADLTSGAVRAGLGFAGGAVAGYALGKLFALPPHVTRMASVTGGLANALRTSGLIS